MEKLLNEIKSFLKTLFCFLIACILLPVLLFSFVCVHYGNEFVYYLLSIKNPNLTISKSKKIRTLIDTKHNAGIFHFLLQVKGTCDFEKIKQYYAEHLTDVRDKFGLLKFPKLRQALVTSFGHYGWVNDTSSFNINHHVLLSPRTYRGRPVTTANIQEFISDLVAKYMPSDLPQWQVIIIPTTQQQQQPNHNTAQQLTTVTDVSAIADQYYILVKIHHLIIAEEEDLHISDLLMLHERDRKQMLDIDELRTVPKPKNLSYFVKQPEHIENLINYVRKWIINQWNAFIYEFDSLEAPDGSRRLQITNITQLLSVLLIVAVNVYRNYSCTMKSREKLRCRTRLPKKENNGRVATFTHMLLKEVDQRNLSWQVARSAIYTSWHPVNLSKTIIKFIWRVNINNFVLLPYHMYCELLAVRDLIFRGQTKQTSTYCGRLSVYLPILVYAQMEFFKILYELYKAPVNVYEELFEHTSKESNILQMKSYSGRKIISFSKSFDAKELRKRINFSAEVRESEFILACLAGGLYEYFQKYEKSVQIPKMLNTTCRTMAKGYLTENVGNKTDYIGGVVFLRLPIKIPDREHARQMHAIIENIRRKQIMVYLASMGQTKFDLLTALIPRVLTKICINFFSHNFPVTITEIHGPTKEFKTLWGQRVEDVMLFRPPQSKTCLSLNIHRFGDIYRLAVMADTQLGSDHSIVTRSFEHFMETATL